MEEIKKRTYTLNQVIQMLEKELEKSKNNSYVKKVMAHSLYNVWKEVNFREEERELK